jgi:flagellar biosynthetic protein FliP
VGILLVLLLATSAHAQAPADVNSLPAINPVDVIEDAGRVVGGATGEALSLSGTLNIIILLTVLSVVPAIVLMCTCFVRIIIVLGLLKQAMGAQSLPPPQVITGLTLLLTLFVMTPTIDRVYAEAIVPYQNGEISSQLEVWERARQPLRDFMFDQIEATGNWSSLYMILEYRGYNVSDPSQLQRADVDMLSLIPAYVLSELKVGFLMGFRVYLPFLVIDMIIASVLISMGMMMLPPVLISAPFKILLFILVDGWTLVVGSLLESVALPGQMEALKALSG